MTLQTADLGVLLSHSQLLAALSGRYGFEHLPFYAEAAKKADITVVYFSPQSFIVNERLIYGFTWQRKSANLQHGLFQIPSVIHNRAFLPEAHRKHINKITALNRTILYNNRLRFDKWDVHQLLLENPLTAGYLPATAPLTSAGMITSCLDRCETVYLKPRSGSLGYGVMRLRDSANTLQLTQTVQGEAVSVPIVKNRLPGIIKKIGSRPYLIQEGISLMEISGQPVDFRVSVQKNAKAKWTVSGVVAKVGRKDAHATNLAVGGIALRAHDVLDPVFGHKQGTAIYDNLQAAALQLAKQLEGLDAFVADLGLDLAVTHDAAVKFIEVNGRDLRITFRDALEEKMWKNTFHNPIHFGAHLLAQKEEAHATIVAPASIDDEAGD